MRGRLGRSRVSLHAATTDWSHLHEVAEHFNEGDALELTLHCFANQAVRSLSARRLFTSCLLEIQTDAEPPAAE